MKKRILSLFACLCMVVCMLPTVSFADEIADDTSVNSSQHNASSIAGFNDVNQNAYYANAVEWAVKQGITTGTSGTTFSPNQVCTRAQVVTFLWRTNGEPEPSSTYNPFYDVSSRAYYYKAVLWAVENNITKGMSNNTFEPDTGCTRGQVVTFLWRAMYEPESSYDSSPFNDVSIWNYYAEAVLWAVENDITNGTSDTTFSPSQVCTRGQIVTFLHRTEVGQIDRMTAMNIVDEFLADNGLDDEWYVADAIRRSEVYHKTEYMVVACSYDGCETDYCVYINNYGKGELVGFWDGNLVLPMDRLFN